MHGAGGEKGFVSCSTVEIRIRSAAFAFVSMHG